MKKALAVLLAVMMLATLAFAAASDLVLFEGAGEDSDGGTGSYPQISPGVTVYFELKDLAGNNYNLFKADSDGKFLPDKNKVLVTFGKGADLVEKQGWVHTDNSFSTRADELGKWQYQIVLKDSNEAVCDGKSLDFSIREVKFKATGLTEAVFKLDDKTWAKCERDYGWETEELPLEDSRDAQFISGFNAKFTEQNVIYTMTPGCDDEGKAVNENTWVMRTGGDYDYFSSVAYKLRTGDRVIRKELPIVTTILSNLTSNNGFDPSKLVYDYEWDGAPVMAVNDTNLVGVATVLNWNPKWHAYAVAADGETVSRIAPQIEDGVATLKVPAFSTVAVYNGVLKNVKSTIGAETPADPKNPATGANDVVGVAAALAVVALVSGAAISLKK